jgi:hypothetical protein
MSTHASALTAAREYSVKEARDATALLNRLRSMSCDRPHPIIGPPCERCLSTVHDALAQALAAARWDAMHEAAGICIQYDGANGGIGLACAERIYASCSGTGKRAEVEK